MIFELGQRVWHFQYGWGQIVGKTLTACVFSTDSGSVCTQLYSNGATAQAGLPVIFLDAIRPENWPNPVAPEPPEPPEQIVVIPDLQLDQPIMVRRDDSRDWVGRHVASVCQTSGIVSAWQNGCTSFTRIDVRDFLQWPQWRLPTEEELKQCRQ